MVSKIYKSNIIKYHNLAGLYPDDPNQYAELDKAISKLSLTDPSVSV
jgi:translation elongation factor EF-4